MFLFFCCLWLFWNVESLRKGLPGISRRSPCRTTSTGDKTGFTLYSTPASSSLADWTRCSVVANKVEAEGLRFVELEVSEELAKTYTVPGQYVKIKVGEGKPGFYAMANSPDAGFKTQKLQFVIKETENNQYIAGAKPGDKLDLSSPQGKGFNLVESFDKYKFDFPTTNVLLMATGSGLAPIAAAIDFAPMGLRKIGFNSLFERKATLYIGARTEEHLPLKSRYADWETKGVRVVPVLSKPSDKWNGKRGYIQEALKIDGIQTPRNSGVLCCGHRGMTDNVRELCLEAGVFEGRILLNF